MQHILPMQYILSSCQRWDKKERRNWVPVVSIGNRFLRTGHKKYKTKYQKKHNTPAPQLPPPLNYFVIVARFWDTELLSNLHHFCFPGIILGPQWHLLKCDMCSPANLIWCFLWSGVQNYKIQGCGELKTYVLGSPHSAMETHRKRADIWQPNLEKLRRDFILRSYT